MEQQASVIAEIVQAILRAQNTGVTRVGIDGVDGAGKTRFADGLAQALELQGVKAIRASVDGFHHPRAVRYQRGRFSSEGFYRDSYDYACLKRVLLDPLSPGGSGDYRCAAFDHQTDAPVDAQLQTAKAGEILVFDGIFLHRPELRAYWDLSVFLAVGFEQSIPRLGARDGGSMDPLAQANRRYVDGQLRYLQDCAPAQAATVVVDNNDWSRPQVLRWNAGGMVYPPAPPARPGAP
ncbi:hypothetical protein N0K08_16930 [Acidovorax sp. Be4]|uniref:Phosphoribulokinase/uridine kinase domain-containing protein n=1 Tax=Acidovorax bellezanensis TaxID=2976702 RepID=A0ABT2PQ10_9BURK|nr:hypothetical protein [Acidovorax sp. Be4]MCT9812328.1 hypothetical protein [Acidovorax sp. Be4]